MSHKEYADGRTLPQKLNHVQEKLIEKFGNPTERQSLNGYSISLVSLLIFFSFFLSIVSNQSRSYFRINPIIGSVKKSCRFLIKSNSRKRAVKR